jgi:RecA-family ATPase
MQDWIPTGSLTLLAGREGLGKSTIAAAIAAPITRGTLAGELHGTPRNVLYVHTEDSREFTVAPRLKAAGADMGRVLFVDVETDVTDSGTLVLPLDTLALDELVVKHNIAFVVLDAATSSMSSELSGKDDRAVRQYFPLCQPYVRHPGLRGLACRA